MRIERFVLSPRHAYDGRPSDGPVPVETFSPESIELRAGHGVAVRLPARVPVADDALTVVAAEALEAVADELGVPRFDPALARRTVVTRGLDVEALRRTAHQLIADRSPLVEFSAASQSFMETIEKSETLKARARAARDDLAQILAEAMSDGSQELTVSKSVLATALFVTTWNVAITQAHSAFRKSLKTEEANAAFLALVDHGVLGIKAVLKGSLYT